MTKLDWEKAKRQERHRSGKREREEQKRERRRRQAKEVADASRYDFAIERGLACFSCGAQPKIGEVAKTGFTKRGAWMVCVPCIVEYKAVRSPA